MVKRTVVVLGILSLVLLMAGTSFALTKLCGPYHPAPPLFAPVLVVSPWVPPRPPWQTCQRWHSVTAPRIWHSLSFLWSAPSSSTW